MKIFFSLLIFGLSFSAQETFAADFKCEIWHQLAGQEKKIIPMEVRSSSVERYVLAAGVEDYSFVVNWDFGHNVLYINIDQGMPKKTILFVTGRAPSEDMKIILTDLHLPEGKRLAIYCSLVL